MLKSDEVDTRLEQMDEMKGYFSGGGAMRVPILEIPPAATSIFAEFTILDDVNPQYVRKIPQNILGHLADRIIRPNQWDREI